MRMILTKVANLTNKYLGATNKIYLVEANIIRKMILIVPIKEEGILHKGLVLRHRN